ncbi:MAG TPA: hypothetical protein VN638_07705 [Nitrospiraceae bacterium]|nr:hypothetical protein [Nitrospiraceae bacterium]
MTRVDLHILRVQLFLLDHEAANLQQIKKPPTPPEAANVQRKKKPSSPL